MMLALRPATDADRAFCEALNRDNMAPYLAARAIAWDPARYEASWREFENYVIEAASLGSGGRRTVPVGLLRLAQEGDALGIRDLQLVPEHRSRGIGTWALHQALAIAGERGHACVQLRVYAENPALRLYEREGFIVLSRDGGTLHMARGVPVRGPRGS